ncbi:glycosyltransferase [Clostridium perfringens]|uniref:Capsular polysaccharide biosynthsis protein n=1 Tax=Clostridium perfringens (strain 13 / Type A) TaxID=195102 RepID=Q8XN37_CLOPE|nr:glycosyltransferase [Clostridium perfringens]BAB80207.1 capsular polysaccharide biosynthsis protein [Clostridium perfringens str. 13]
MVKVSIIIPIYNVENYLDKCLDTAVNQTLGCIEIIGIDDGSTDKSRDILNKYAKKYSFIKIINKENGGLSSARNTGIINAKGEYIYFLDSDDYIEYDSMKICYEIATKNKLDIVSFDAESFVDGEGFTKKLKKYDRKDILDGNIKMGCEYFCELIKNKCYTASACLNFYRREFLIDNNLFFYDGILHEDELYTVKAYTLANKVRYIPYKLYFRRLRSNSITTQSISEKHLYGRLIAARESYRHYLGYKDVFDNDTNTCLLNHISNMYYFMLKDIYENKRIYNKRYIIEDKIINDIKSKKDIKSFKLDLQYRFPLIIYTIKKYLKKD